MGIEVPDSHQASLPAGFVGHDPAARQFALAEGLDPFGLGLAENVLLAYQLRPWEGQGQGLLGSGQSRKERQRQGEGCKDPDHGDLRKGSSQAQNS